MARIRRTTTAGVIALAVAGFAMSYEALHALAREQGVPAGLAWLWPLVVDGFILVASLAVVHAALDGRRTLYPWFLVIGFSGLSVGFNVLHAGPAPAARLVAAVPPTAMVFSFELLMRQIRGALVPVPAPMVAEPVRARSAPVPLVPAKRQTGGTVLEQARGLIATRGAADAPVTGAVLAAELGVSDGYGRRILRELTTETGTAR